MVTGLPVAVGEEWLGRRVPAVRPVGQERPGCRVLTVRPVGAVGERLPAVLWLHGGGYLTGLPEHGQDLLERMAHELRAVIVSPDYRLAPEYPYPHGLNDGRDVLAWLHHDAPGADAGRIAIGGSSAGAGLAAALALHNRDVDGLPPAFLAVGTLDLFLAEDVDYARRLMRAGVPTELHVEPGAVHGYLGMPGTRLGGRLRAALIDALGAALN
ncbi:hypothetical protein Q0Z83_048020 [Actinoplanes sichuanensis]|uniref:Alpha/beta hydrolase n=1 Tax=Actinoplanes sichuanensis TaxID=512349 RepID=A0ABW4APD3_9ACTN|nr:alpha/beta hydrolase fold domain-containing protein [Actinoplanes sichuanensis]BEL06611.1 hypothetical protein Q0Z83_048020 [Actinoplanes sichuanensis]